MPRDPHSETALVARAFRTADLALATTPGCRTVGQMTKRERDLLEIGILCGITALRGHLNEKRMSRG